MDEDKVTALKNQGNDALAEEKYAEAIKFYTRAIELDKTNHVLFSNRSAAFAKAENFEAALGDAESTIRLKPDWVKGYSRKGAALSFLGRNDEAIEAYQDGLKVDPNNVQLKEALADVNRAGNKPKGLPNPFAGIEALSKLRNDPRTRAYLDDPEFLKTLQELQSNPDVLYTKLNDPKIMTALGVLIGLDANFDEPMDTEPVFTPKPQPKPAETTESKEVKEDGDGQLPEYRKKAIAAKEFGNEAYKKRKFAEALEHYTQAVESDPTDITFYNNIAAVYFEQKEYEKCIEQCNKAIEVGRENRADFKLIAKAFTRIGNSYKKLGDWVAAKTNYEKSMSEHRTPEIKSLLSDIDKLIKEKELLDYIDPVKAEEEKEMGNELFKNGDYANAVKHYTEAIKRNPEEVKYYSNRAACYTKLAAFDLGLKDCEKCVAMDPKFIKGWIRKGHILQGMQQSSKAAVAFQRALELDPNNSEALAGFRSCSVQTNSDPAQVRARAMADPEVQAILRDPAMRLILEQMQNDPKALQDHLKNPDIAAKIQKLLESGLIAIR